jgi:hypothetical protein
MFGLFKTKKPSPERQEFDDALTLLLSGLDDQGRAQARSFVDLDGLFEELHRKDGETPVQAAFQAVRLILNVWIDRMTNQERELHRNALAAQDWNDPFCKVLNYMGQVAEQFEKQGRVKPMLIRMLFSCTAARLRGLPTLGVSKRSSPCQISCDLHRVDPKHSRLVFARLWQAIRR